MLASRISIAELYSSRNPDWLTTSTCGHHWGIEEVWPGDAEDLGGFDPPEHQMAPGSQTGRKLADAGRLL